MNSKEYKQKLDFIMSVGPACRPAEHLARNGLRRIASPLDWQKAYSLSTVIHLFSSKFKDFFQTIKEDYIEKNSDCKKRVVIDTHNNIVSLHHFDKENPLSEERKTFCELMQARYAKTDEIIRASRKVALICNRSNTIKEFENFIIEFSKIYPLQEILLINIRHVEREGLKRSDYNFGPGLNMVEFEFCDVHENGEDLDANPDAWKGNIKKWDEVLSNFTLSNTPTFFEQLQNAKKDSKKIIIYGAGVNGNKVAKVIQKCGFNVFSYAVTDLKNNPAKIHGIPVKRIDDLRDYASSCVVILAVQNANARKKIISVLEKEKFDCIIGWEYNPFCEL